MDEEMNFRTQVELPERQAEIHHSDRIMLFGSCFAENIGNLLMENKFRCDVNPFGVLYNPVSIVKALRQLLEGKVYDETDLFFSRGEWHSWMHHSNFSASTSGECLQRVNERLLKATDSLRAIDWLVVTWGTSYVYQLQDSDEVVGNCHKQPDKMFIRSKLDVGTIVYEWLRVIADIKIVNPKVKVLFTVSPIRHVKDSMHGNQVSKSTLLLAIDELCRSSADCYYFPSYEIMMDELRDYRFYADDMIHPSRIAIEYIWLCFSKCYFNLETRTIMQEWEEIKKGLAHRPYAPESEAYRSFLSQIVLKIMQMKEKFPYLEVQKEIELCESRLKM